MWLEQQKYLEVHGGAVESQNYRLIRKKNDEKGMFWTFTASLPWTFSSVFMG